MVDRIDQCYEALGIVHSLYRPVPGRFKDYIAAPKSNKYQSLHTTVIGPQSQRIEIQIRTQEMHIIAEHGVAAHWAYKSHSTDFSKKIEKQKFPPNLDWVKKFIDLDTEIGNSNEFLEGVKSDLLSEEEIYVFTPKGEVKELREGSCALDFAYAIHTNIGTHCIGAKVNGHMVPLRHKLQSGDTVEIRTSVHQRPSKDWLNYCVTTRAKSKIRSFVRTEERTRSISLGKEILEKEFAKFGYKLEDHLKTPQLQKHLSESGLQTEEDLFSQIAYGKQNYTRVLRALVPDFLSNQEDKKSSHFLSKMFTGSKRKRAVQLVHVDGLSDLLVHYGKCCLPVYGDPIVGFITRGRGITVHQAACPKTFQLDPNRRVGVQWAPASNEARSHAKVRVLCHDNPGLLKAMSEQFASHGINIYNAQIRNNRDKKALCIFYVMVRNATQVLQLIKSLEKVKGVIRAERILFS